MDATQLFKILSDTTRLRCLALLHSHNELCVCELTQALELPQPKISHHLSALRKLELVNDRKAGLWVYYRINEQLPDWVVTVIRTTMEGIREEEPYMTDRSVLDNMYVESQSLCS